jgi:3'-phosphoadenosine 5'-phosphosulfate sulfotransferase (PAPS reductase)/FAD synthetase
MLWRVLESNGGKLPAEALVTFANTGREDEATLQFVRDCGENWGVPISWLEYSPEAPGFKVVNFETASRDGEPFMDMIKKERYLPNPMQRICTSRLKVRTMHKYQRSLGWEEWDQMIGIRADEQRRVVKLRNRPSPETKDEITRLPLADAGITVQDVNYFWSQQPFNLALTTVNGRTLAGNCDLCFLKPGAQIQSLIAEKPERAIWWAGVEKYAKETFWDKQHARACLFRMDRPSYGEMLKFTEDQRDMFDPNEEAISCFCGD